MYKLVLIIIFLSVGTNSYSAPRTYGDLEEVSYIRNFDGDTITFNIPNLHPLIGDSMPIRVNGIDTPEIRGKCASEKAKAKEVKDVVSLILKNSSQVTLKNIKRGKYFSIVADVIVDGESLGGVLLSRGLAVEYDGGTKHHDWCLD